MFGQHDFVDLWPAGDGSNSRGLKNMETPKKWRLLCSERETTAPAIWEEEAFNFIHDHHNTDANIVVFVAWSHMPLEMLSITPITIFVWTSWCSYVVILRERGERKTMHRRFISQRIHMEKMKGDCSPRLYRFSY